ncbi:major facilitator superfamily MFS_1 [Cellulomonas flavigena DSM 20109]|uniref:Major facilitator superfamily MFS_1 n=1 Tax=Cellulomonas flavigena (strain ATCC 482 / DSM 20109 / BCRC 11376 / JCM 18109 / NBRC 3775 / NCIMB 8073 / NRS 134) TaxID=446466 RepID=D5UFE5_CELFN|nr:MFS transporter [Cellulomonas flavigena]ADG74942.1 major facilitator superfamily MFS_1 [Cellulomonas flavigena DSM 20109]
MSTLRPRLVRDRLTLGLYTPYVVWGWLLYSFNPSVPLLADELGVTAAQAGLHGTAMALGGLASAPVTPRAVRRAGRRATVVTALLLVAVGVAALLLGPTLPWTLAGMFVTALGGNVMIAATQVGIAQHTGPAASAAITEANGAGSSVGLIGPLAVGACVAAGWGWRPGVAVTAALAVVAALVVSRLPAAPALPALRRRAAAAPDEEAVAPVEAAAAPAPAPRQVPRHAAWLFLAALVAATALENATTYWATDLVLSRTDAGAGIATATTAGLVAGMSVMRFIVGPLSLRVPPAILLAASFGIAIVGWALLWTATDVAVALTGLVIAGFGYGAQYPLGVALLLSVSPGQGDRAQAHATLAGALAIGVAPFLLGALADAFGTHQAFLLVPVLAAAGVVVAMLGGRAVRSRVPADLG